MLRIAICDNDTDACSYLSSLVKKQACSCTITQYTSADECLADCQKTDLFFLDICFDAKVHSPDNTVTISENHNPDGITLAQKLRERNPEIQPVIIFVTGYEQYVFDAFDVNAFQYLLKPVNEQKFARVFSDAIKQIEVLKNPMKKVRMLTLQSANTNKIIPLDQIYYIESSNHKVVLHLKDGEFTYYEKISNLEEELQGQFFRIHKGYLVNLACIEAYSKTEATLTNGNKLLISKYKYRNFVKAYLLFLKKESGL